MGVAVEAHVTVDAVLGGALGDSKVLGFDAGDDGGEGGDGGVDGSLVGGEGDEGVAGLFAGVVEVGAGDGVAGEAGDDVGVDVELVAVAGWRSVRRM